MVKRMVAARDLPAGHVLTEADFDYRIPVEAKITPNALPPYWVDCFIGKTLVTAVPAEEIIGWTEIGETPKQD
jgi:N-acetylneuraminate synthase/sialic acid synthase